ncbi:cell division protein ZapE [Deinococcus sonorensis]|uniref:Cell division protein ZapE n=2 Tax=Deinococcus sonorensis TaxID=309891 RepID=A0AAU7UDC3_9DEIO
MSVPAAAPAGIDLSVRHPELDPEQLTAALTPGARFQDVRFASYRPNPDFPSQQQASDRMQQFVAGLGAEQRSGFLGLKRRPAEGRGLYLDGGFGVGKTHLLASAYHAAAVPKAFMSFQDLMYVIGALGMPRAVQAFRGLRLLCIDEFELDDPGNTHMANTFLGELMPAGLNVIATSNTQPGALGQGRFNAQDFARQIQAITGRFESLALDGPDYRQRGSAPAEPLSEAEYRHWRERQDPATLAELTFTALQPVLLGVHPARFPQLLDGVAALGLTGLAPMNDQGPALRLVHFIDKVYDLGVAAAFTGAPLGTLFDETYRYGAFAKKYARCLSRLSELLNEARVQDRD